MKLENILFLDIETVPLHPSFNDLSQEAQQLFADKTSYQRKETPAADFYERAGIWAEFGKIVCLSIGYFTSLQSKPRQFRLTSFYGEEAELLTNFSQTYCSTDNFPSKYPSCLHILRVLSSSSTYLKSRAR